MHHRQWCHSHKWNGPIVSVSFIPETIDGYTTSPLYCCVIAVPDVTFTKDTASYIIHLDNGSVETIPADLRQNLVTSASKSSDGNPANPYPSWISHNAHCTREHNSNILKGKFFHIPNNTSEFHSTNRNGILKQRYPLPNFHKIFIFLINLGLICPGWSNATLVPTAYHVSAILTFITLTHAHSNKL